MWSAICNRYRLGLCCLLFLALASCSTAATPTVTTPPAALRLGVSDSVRTLVEILVPVYGQEVPAVVMDTEVANIVSLLGDLKLRKLDAAIVAGEPRFIAQQSGQDEAEPWWVSAVALDGVALVVNPENRVSGLTLPQARGVFQGQVWSWDMVGGPAASIEVVTREGGTAAAELFQGMVMEEQRITLTAVVMPDTMGVLDYVAQHPWAIGYIPVAALDSRVKPLAIEGILPSLDTIQDQSFPLTYPVVLISPDEPEGALRRFASWLLSRDGQAVIGRRYGKVR